jgi:hypothetical protein
MSDEQADFRNVAAIEPLLPDLRRTELAELTLTHSAESLTEFIATLRTRFGGITDAPSLSVSRPTDETAVAPDREAD